MKKNKIKLVLTPRIKGSKKNMGEKIQPPKKSKAVIELIKIILPYSARKNKANPILAYSTLNPETNSDSASGRSNGARLVSAKIDTKNIKKRGKRGNTKKVLL
jgi:hypothetical protein